jgi:hypothetical protein
LAELDPIDDRGRVEGLGFQPQLPAAFPDDWIVTALDRLGLGSHRHYRLYEDDPSLDSSHQLAS